MTRALFWISLVLFLLGAAGLAAWFLVLRPVLVRVPDELPAGFPEEGFSHEAFEGLLARFVTPDGGVRYDAWHGDDWARRELDRYLAALARYSPENAAGRFPDEPARLAYWLNAYNACVIKGVLMHWPIGSVHDVQAPVEVKAGLGFFWRLEFVLGGRRLNLYSLENEVIRGRFTDPRIHFVLNCASGGCPVLRPELPEGPELEPYLAQATRDFLEAHVTVDREARTVTVSPILDWYREDFLADLARRNVPERTVLRWLQVTAPGLVPDTDGYQLRFSDYDWTVNDG